MLDSFVSTAFANLDLVPTKLETTRNFFPLIFSNKTASFPSVFAVIAAISYFWETAFFTNLSCLPFFRMDRYSLRSFRSNHLQNI